MRYEDESIWLTQKVMAQLYGVEVHTVNEHIKRIFSDGESLRGQRFGISESFKLLSKSRCAVSVALLMQS